MQKAQLLYHKDIPAFLAAGPASVAEKIGT
jgi:hypothetical protein